MTKSLFFRPDIFSIFAASNFIFYCYKIMKVHTTNYTNTLITIAEDCPIHLAQVPPVKGEEKPIAYLQFEAIIDNPYSMTSDDLVFQSFALKNNLPHSEWESERQRFFSKGQPCLRCSALTKRYGWGIHSNEEGKIALLACDSDTYRNLVENSSVKKVKAMKSGKK